MSTELCWRLTIAEIRTELVRRRVSRAFSRPWGGTICVCSLVAVFGILCNSSFRLFVVYVINDPLWPDISLFSWSLKWRERRVDPRWLTISVLVIVLQQFCPDVDDSRVNGRSGQSTRFDSDQSFISSVLRGSEFHYQWGAGQRRSMPFVARRDVTVVRLGDCRALGLVCCDFFDAWCKIANHWMMHFASNCV